MIPSKIGDWQVIDKLGSGGQGLVLRAKKMQLNGKELEAAIKVPTYDFSELSNKAKAELQSALVHEFEMLELVSSPNVCRVIDSGIEVTKKGQKTVHLPWLATELIRGDDLLSEINKNGPLDETAWMQLAWDIASGLEAIHEVGATHLDLKPQNVVRHARRAIVIDLGGASFVGKFDLGDLIQAKTIPFAAPEQLDEKFDPEDYEYPVDLYSMGATLFFAATAEGLFNPGRTTDKVAEARARYKMMKTEKFNTSKLSNEQTQIISALCRFRPSDRISLTGLQEILINYLPERDSRRSNNKQSANQMPAQVISENSIDNQIQSNPKMSRPLADLDIGGWIATLFLIFLPPIIGPLVRFYQLRDTQPNTSQRGQLRTLLALGSLFSFGIVGALAFIRKSTFDKSKITRIIGIVFFTTSILSLISTFVGAFSNQGTTMYLALQTVGTVGIAANMFLIAPLSATLGVFDPKPKAPAQDEQNSESTAADSEQAESSKE